MKKLLTVGLVLMMLVGLMVPAFAAGTGEYMWVNCANGKTLNLRADANTKARVLKRLECGTRVELIPYSNPTAGWSCVRANGTDGWVMTNEEVLVAQNTSIATIRFKSAVIIIIQNFPSM